MGLLVANTGDEKTTYSDTAVPTTATTVHYRVSAINLVGAGMASNITLAGALKAPAAPTMLKAAAVSGTQIDLSWTAPKDPDEAPVTGYKIEFNTAAATVDAQASVEWSVLVADTESTSTTHMDTTLMNGDLRHYRVKAINKAGTGMELQMPQWQPPGIKPVPADVGSRPQRRMAPPASSCHGRTAG